MTRRPELEARRDRVRRLAAKRPPFTVDVTHAPSPSARERLVDLLVELLDERIRSGRR
jgi:hypothetical protein